MPVDERDKLASDDFVEVEDENVLRPHAAQGRRLHARHVVHVDFQRGVAAERRGVARQLPAAGMPVRPVANAVSLGSEEIVERGIDMGPFDFHSRPVERTDIVQVDIDQEPVETEEEEVEPVAQIPVGLVAVELVGLLRAVGVRTTPARSPPASRPARAGAPLCAAAPARRPTRSTRPRNRQPPSCVERLEDGTGAGYLWSWRTWRFDCLDRNGLGSDILPDTNDLRHVCHQFLSP